MCTDPGDGFACSGELTRVVAVFVRSVVLGVRDFVVHLVILITRGDRGGPVQQGKEPPSPRGTESSLANLVKLDSSVERLVTLVLKLKI